MIMRLKKIFAVIFLCYLGMIIYSNTFFSPFHLDDEGYIVRNINLRALSNLKAIWNFAPHRFVAILSLAFNYHFSKLNVFGYHLFNLAIHLTAAILVCWLVLLVLSTAALKEEKVAAQKNFIAFFAGLIFVAHPVQTEAVTYICQRFASLATLFYLASFCLYIKSRLLQNERRQGRAGKIYFSGSLLAAIAAMFSKEIAVTLPLMILFFEFYFLKKDKAVSWRLVVAFLATLTVIPLTYMFAYSLRLTDIIGSTQARSGITPWHYLLTQFRVIVTYLRLLFIPINQNLDYDYPLSQSLGELPLLGSLFILITILVTAVIISPRKKLISFSIFWFFLTLLPESSVIPLKDIIFEHRLYLPMVGYSLFLSTTIYYLFTKDSLKPALIILVIIISVYATLAYVRNFVWQDNLTLWNDVVRKSPKKARPYNNRGKAYLYRNRLAEAISDFSKSIEIEPGFLGAYVNRGIAYKEKGDFALAISDFNQAIEINPHFAEAYNNRAVAYFLRKEYDKSWQDVQRTEALGHAVYSGFLEMLKKASGRER